MGLIDIRDVTVVFNESFSLHIPQWTFHDGENWFVTGPNGSGKSGFGRLLAGMAANEGSMTVDFSRHGGESVAWVSPELERQFFLEELRNDDSEFMEGGFDPGRSAEEIILTADGLERKKTGRYHDYVDMLGLRHVLHRGFRFLSAGETRRVLVAKALIREPALLILDDPFAGLDRESRVSLGQSLDLLMDSGMGVVLIGSPGLSLPDRVNRILCLDKGRVCGQGPRHVMVQTLPFKAWTETSASVGKTLPRALVSPPPPFDGEVLVHLDDVSVEYGGQPVFENLTWTLRRGEHWAIVGPNGAGKSTLLSMISGDNPKAYGKDLWLFGKKRGTGESVWDIKKRFGIVSGEIHRNYRVSATLLHVVISGFFDSIGIYDPISPAHIRIAREWLDLAGLTPEADVPFAGLSFGRQRMALILRAMVKHPLVLILDEPCQGLDNTNRRLVLELVDVIADLGHTHILHVTHDPEERLRCTNHRLRFVKKAAGGFEGIIEPMPPWPVEQGE